MFDKITIEKHLDAVRGISAERSGERFADADSRRRYVFQTEYERKEFLRSLSPAEVQRALREIRDERARNPAPELVTLCNDYEKEVQAYAQEHRSDLLAVFGESKTAVSDLRQDVQRTTVATVPAGAAIPPPNAPAPAGAPQSVSNAGPAAAPATQAERAKAIKSKIEASLKDVSISSVKRTLEEIEAIDPSDRFGRGFATNFLIGKLEARGDMSLELGERGRVIVAGNHPNAKAIEELFNSGRFSPMNVRDALLYRSNSFADFVQVRTDSQGRVLAGRDVTNNGEISTQSYVDFLLRKYGISFQNSDKTPRKVDDILSEVRYNERMPKQDKAFVISFLNDGYPNHEINPAIQSYEATIRRAQEGIPAATMDAVRKIDGDKPRTANQVVADIVRNPFQELGNILAKAGPLGALGIIGTLLYFIFTNFKSVMLGLGAYGLAKGTGVLDSFADSIEKGKGKKPAKAPSQQGKPTETVGEERTRAKRKIFEHPAIASSSLEDKEKAYSAFTNSPEFLGKDVQQLQDAFDGKNGKTLEGFFGDIQICTDQGTYNGKLVCSVMGIDKIRAAVEALLSVREPHDKTVADLFAMSAPSEAPTGSGNAAAGLAAGLGLSAPGTPGADGAPVDAPRIPPTGGTPATGPNVPGSDASVPGTAAPADKPAYQPDAPYAPATGPKKSNDEIDIVDTDGYPDLLALIRLVQLGYLPKIQETTFSGHPFFGHKIEWVKNKGEYFLHGGPATGMFQNILRGEKNIAWMERAKDVTMTATLREKAATKELLSRVTMMPDTAQDVAKLTDRLTLVTDIETKIANGAPAAEIDALLNRFQAEHAISIADLAKQKHLQLSTDAIRAERADVEAKIAAAPKPAGVLAVEKAKLADLNAAILAKNKALELSIRTDLRMNHGIKFVNVAGANLSGVGLKNAVAAAVTENEHAIRVVSHLAERNARLDAIAAELAKAAPDYAAVERLRADYHAFASKDVPLPKVGEVRKGVVEAEKLSTEQLKAEVAATNDKITSIRDEALERLRTLEARAKAEPARIPEFQAEARDFIAKANEQIAVHNSRGLGALALLPEDLVRQAASNNAWAKGVKEMNGGDGMFSKTINAKNGFGKGVYGVGFLALAASSGNDIVSVLQTAITSGKVSASVLRGLADGAIGFVPVVGGAHDLAVANNAWYREAMTGKAEISTPEYAIRSGFGVVGLIPGVGLLVKGAGKSARMVELGATIAETGHLAGKVGTFGLLGYMATTTALQVVPTAMEAVDGAFSQ